MWTPGYHSPSAHYGLLAVFSSFQVTFSRLMSAQSNERMKYYVTVLSWQHMDSLVTSCRIARNFAGWDLNVMTFLALKNSWQTGNSNGFLQTVFNVPLSFHLIAGFAGNVCFFKSSDGFGSQGSYGKVIINFLAPSSQPIRCKLKQLWARPVRTK